MSGFTLPPDVPPGVGTKAEHLAIAGKGWCMICDEDVGEDIQTHFADVHGGEKLKTGITGWKTRTDEVIATLKEIRQSEHPEAEVKKLDEEVIQKLYLIRQALTAKRRNQSVPDE